MPTDNQDDLAAAGLNLTRQVSPDEILSPEQLDEQTLAADLLQTQNYAKQQEVSTGDQALNIARGTLTGAAIEQGLTPSFKVDPLFSLDRFKERLADAQKTLPAEYLDGLDRALSDEQFDYLYGRAKSLYQSQQELANAGLGAGVANFAAQIIDPAAWVVGGGIATMAIKSARAAQLGRAGQRAANAAGGALGGVATIGSLDALDIPQAPEGYLLAAGFGMSLGALFGPLGKNPAIAREAGVIHEAGEKLVKEALMLPPPPKQLTYAGIKRAEGAVDDVIQVAPEAGQVPQRLSPRDVIEVAPEPQPSAVQQAVDDVSAALAGEDVNPLPSVQAAADEILNPGAAEAKPSKPSAGLVHENPEAAAEKMTEMGAQPRLDRNRQRIRDQRIAFEKFRAAQQAKKGSAALAEAKPLPGKLGDAPEGYTFRGTTYRMVEDEDGVQFFQAFREGVDGPIGEMEVSVSKDGRKYISWNKVEEPYRNTPAAYGFGLVAQKLGIPNIPDGRLSPDSFPIWAKRLPWVKDAYVQDISATGKMSYISPKLLKENIRHLRSEIKNGADFNGKPYEPKLLNIFAERLAKYEQKWAALPKWAKTADNLRSMFAAKRDPLANRMVHPNARAAVDETLDRILPKNVKRVVADELAEDGSLDGLYRDRVVYIALNANDPVNIAYHEGGHALKQLGLFTPKEWTRLTKEAQRIGADKRYRIQERYGDDGLNPLQLEEEAVMHMLGDRLQGKTFGKLDAVLDKVVRVLRQIRDALGLKGFRTTQDIFDDIDSGRIAARSQTAQPDAQAAMAARGVGAQATPAVTHDWLQDADWRSVQDGDVPRSAGFWRFDNAGISGQSDNAPERLIGTSLLNDSVGKGDHSLNPFSADQDYRRITNVYQGEFHKTARPAFQDWADDLNLSTAQRIMREHEFFEQAGRYVDDRNRQPGDYHPAVARLGDKAAKLQAEILEDLKNPLRREGLQGRPIHGSELVPEDEHYLWRKFSHDKVRGAVDQQTGFGQTGVIRMISGAIRSAQPGIDNELVERLARGYLMNIHSRAVGLGDEWSMALSRGDWDRFHEILTTTSNLTADEANDIIARLSRRQPEGDMANLKRRVFLDETYVERNLPRGQQGDVADLAFNDLLERNLNNVFSHYLRRASGRIALGRVRVQHPDGSVLINGIVSDREIDNVLRMTQQWGLDNGQLPVHAAESVERLRFAFDRILGIPDPRQSSSMGQWLRLTRAYMSTRLMGQVGIAQLGESGAAVGTLGLRSLFQHVPAFRRVMDAAGDIRNNIPLMEELEAMGIGVERLHGLHYHNLDEVGELPFEVAGKPRMERVLNNARSLENLTYEASGMSLIQQRQEMWVAGNMASKIANMAARLQAGNGLGRGDIRRLAQLGIDEPMMARIMNEMRQHTDATEGMFFGRKVNRLNADRWSDLEARAALENALFRSTKKIIQSGDEGSAAFWMSNPIAQTIFQFRGFAFTAWNNQLLYNIHMGDPAALATFVTSVGWAGAVRAAQISLLAAARSDGEEYKEKYLTPWELGKAGFQRAGWSSIIPMGIDSGLALTGQPGMFNARTTGQASDLIFGNPAMSFMDNAAKGIGGSVNALAEGRSPSQAEVRQLVGLAPFSNLMPITAGLSYLIQDLPERSPRRRINY